MRTLELDPDQLEVATADPTARQVVIAGPGAGKTQVVSALVENLILVEEIDPAHGLLVLSFSNAAVHAVDARLRARNVPPVHVRTIDSLASRIISEAADEDHHAMTFVERIVLATALVRDGEWYDADDLEHLVVDEVQDVVGVRADFLLALMEALPETSGLTLLGDPAQAIYDFQLRQPGETDTTATQVLQRARDAGARTVVLKGQYRASSRDTKAAALLRGSDGGTPNPDDVEDFWNDVVHADNLAGTVDLVRRRGGDVAFLTSTNGQALAVAEELRTLGVNAEVRKGARNQNLAGWIAQVAQRAGATSLSVEEFRTSLSEVAPGVDPVNAWRAVRSIAGGRGAELDVASLSAELARRDSFPPDLLTAPGARPVVSTVHRAKGLEFGTVVLVEFPNTSEAGSAGAGTGREMFVALTRARDLLLRVDGPDTKWLKVVPGAGAAGPRWIRGGPKPWMTTAFEVRASDVDPSAQANAPCPEHTLIAAVGSAVELVALPDKSSLTVPIYEARFEGTRIATLSSAFGADFAARTGTLEGSRRGWPSMTKVYVESLATVADASSGSRCALGLAPVLSGLAEINWRS